MGPIISVITFKGFGSCANRICSPRPSCSTSTGTWNIDAEIPVFTALQAGFLLGESVSLTLGDLIELDPPHCDPTFNLYGRVYVCRGDEVESVWPSKGVDRMSA